MAKNRHINTEFWTDPTIREMSTSTKLLQVYLLANNHSNIVGIYKISKEVMRFETGINNVDKAIKDLISINRIAYKDDWVVTVNNINNQNIKSSRIISGLHRIVDSFPSWITENIKIREDPFFAIDYSGLFGKAIDYGKTEPPPKDEAKKKSKPEIDVSIMFDAFWKAYPRKVGKDAAEKAFKKIKLTEKLLHQIAGSLDAYKKSWNEIKFIPHASTWLNQKRYKDNIDDIDPKAENIIFE